ncbi:MAG: type IV pilus assembly protein PilM [Patescibacteria group bacterium]
MVWNPFSPASKNFLGIDIGTTAIKVIELSKRGDRIKLENYGEASAQTLYEKPFRTIDKNTLLFSSQEIARALLAIFEEAKIAEKKSIFSIPDFASFFIDFSLPPMTKEELPEAIKYEAKQYIPMPFSEVTLDWLIIGGEMGKGRQKSTPLKILLVAVPTEIINQYQEIASLSGIKLQAIEAEAFGLLRSLIGNDKRTVCIIDIGAQSTTINIVDNGILKKSHSFDVSGGELTQLLTKSLDIDFDAAERLKRETGLEDGGREIKKILMPLVDYIASEAEKILKAFLQQEGREPEKIILAGGSAQMPGLKKYFSETFKKETEIANPFIDIFYPPVLEETLKQMGSSYAIAVGMALRGLELN